MVCITLLYKKRNAYILGLLQASNSKSMSIIYCHKHDRHVDTDYDTDCPECEDEEVEVAPGIYQSKEDYEANAAYDAANGN